MKNYIEMGYQMAVKFPTCYPQQIEKLLRISHSLTTLDVRSCNYGLSEKEEQRIENLEKKASLIASEFGAIAYHQSDPRGCSLYVLNESDIPNDNSGDRNPEKMVRQYYTRGVAIY